MMLLLTSRKDEIPVAEDQKMEAYLASYLAFYERFRGERPKEVAPRAGDRSVDQALWTFGKFIKSFPKYEEVPSRWHVSAY